MCAVRALTEGEPRTWWPDEPAEVTGVVLRQGSVPSQFSIYGGEVAFVDLWLGGTERVRVMAYGAMLSGALFRAAPEVGDTLTVAYEGKGRIERGKHAGREFRKHTVSVTRGHH